MNWTDELDNFRQFLRLEKNFTPNSVKAYMNDMEKLVNFFELRGNSPAPEEVKIDDLREFLVYLGEEKIAPRTQSRITSGIKAFYKYLLIEEKIEVDPTTLLETPKVGRKLPEVLSLQEIDAIINSIDTTKLDGIRNRAMLETLYSCGLRVSELVNLKISECVFDEGYIRVTGKGRKQRLVPLGMKAIAEINNYIAGCRRFLNVAQKDQDVLFLNKNGEKLSRIMVFKVIKEHAKKAGITKNISPHTFRHSFATHLLDGGANLRAVQEMLGHESIVTTEIYTHVDSNYLRDTINLYHPRSRQ